MFALRALALLSLASAAAGIQVNDEIQHNLTVCNAYADAKPLSVYTLNNKAKLTEEPLPYKQCKDITMELKDDERIDFKLGGLSVGTFRASGVPFVSSGLVLVPFKRGNGTMSASFASHAFTPSSEQAQVAIIDAYAGPAAGAMKIKVDGLKKQGSQQLKPGSALLLSQGSYEVSLEDSAGKRLKASQLRAGMSTNHVVMRVGADEFPQELVLFEFGKDQKAAYSGSLRAGLGLVSAIAALLALA